MIHKIKFRLRQLLAEGKYETAIKTLMKLYQFVKSLRERFGKASALKVLQEREFGHTPKAWLDFIWSAQEGYFRPIQQPEELLKLIEKVNEQQPKSVLEIGTAKGGCLFLFCRAATPSATIVSIDLPGGINGGGYPNWKSTLFQQFKQQGQTLHLLRSNSHHESTRNKARSLAPTGKYDLIMIDGDHSYQGVKTDFELYRSLLSENGMMIFHDVIKNRFDPSIQVDRFWEELKTKYSTEEIVFNRNQGNMGIGIVSL